MGTNRLVLVLRRNVIKIPLHHRGLQANREEYNNYSKAPVGAVAQTVERGIFLIQERLTDIEIYPKHTKREDMPPYARPLFDIKLHNRLQIGRDCCGRWKIFDYEDIKKWEELTACEHQN